MSRDCNSTSSGETLTASQADGTVVARMRSRSDYVFPQRGESPNARRSFVFRRRLTKSFTHSDSLHLYNSIKVDDQKTMELNKARKCTDDLLSSLPSSGSSDTTSTVNSSASDVLRSSESLCDSNFANFGSSSCRIKRAVSKKSNGAFSIGKYFGQSLSSELSRNLTTPPGTPSIGYRVESYSPFTPVQRSLSVPNSLRTPRRKRLSIFGYRNPVSMSTPVTSSRSPTATTGDVKLPAPERFTTMYQAVRKAVSEHISVNTAELNVLQMRQKDADVLNAGQSYEVEKLVKYLERVINKLQYQQTQLDEIHEAYVLQQRYRDGATKLKSALSSSRVSSRSSKLELKADLTRSTETLCALEHELMGFFGRFHFEMKGLLGFAKLRSGDQYEVLLRHGSQKWRMKGTVKSLGDQTWDNTHSTMQPLLSENIQVKVMEIKMLGKHTTVGNVVCEIKDFFKAEPQDLTIELNDTATLKLSLNVQWSPYDGYETPVRAQGSTTSWTSDYNRSRAKSVAERSISSYASPRSKHGSALSRPLSSFHTPSANSNNCNNNNQPFHKTTTPLIGKELDPTREDSLNNDSNLESHRLVLSEEDAFLKSLERNRSLANSIPTDTSGTPDEKKCSESKEEVRSRFAFGRKLSSALIQLNFDLDDVRGRYPELAGLENVVSEIIENLKEKELESVETDGFSVLSYGEDEEYPASMRDEVKHPVKDFLPLSGGMMCKTAMIVHINFARSLLKDIGVFGPLKVRELLALDKLQKQGEVLQRLFQIATSENPFSFDDMPEFSKRRTLLEMWRSCCDGNTSLCVTARTLRLELTAAFGREVRRRNPDVADNVFHEVVRRVLSLRDTSDVEMQTVTLFHVFTYVEEAGDDGDDDLGKLVNKLAIEMFITSTLSCGVQRLVLAAISRVSSLLALRTGNLRALSHLLLHVDHTVRTATAAHLCHIATDASLRKKALLSFAELLESFCGRDRQCACIAIGFIGATECIPHLAHLYQCDLEAEVREAASNVLLSLGDEGIEARDYASSTILMQTMTQKVLGSKMCMGAAL